MTAYTIQARASCRADRQAYGVAVLFLPAQSWIKPDQRSPRILTHEQGHFDLGEVSARRLRAALAELDAPCGAGDTVFRKVVEEFQQRDAKLQRSYDRQTMYGVSAGPQRQWDARIRSWLRKEKP